MSPDPSTARRRADDESADLRNERFGTGGIRSLVERVGWAGVAEVANLAVTFAMLLVLVDTLGPDLFGDLQAVIGIASIVGPISTFGANWSLIRRGVVSKSMRFEVGRAINLATIGTTGGMLATALVLLAFPGVLPGVSRSAAVLILVGQMPAYWLTELAVTAAVAKADLKLSAQLRLVAAYFRIMAVIVFAFGPNHSLEAWAWHFAAGNLLAAVGVHLILAISMRRFPGFVRPLAREFREGLPYGIGNTTEGVLSASDRPLMSQYGLPGDDGIYSVGYRVVTLGLVPMTALFKAQDRRFFRQGALGSVAAHEAGRRMSMLALAATLPVSIALFLGAPLFDLFVDERWAETETVIRFLAILPIIKGFQFAFGNSLTAAGNQRMRLQLTAVAAIGNLVANFFLIPIWSWRAAAGTTLVAEVALGLGLFAASRRYADRAS